MEYSAMLDESDLRKKLDEKSTTELQDSIRNNRLIDQASAIARIILKERGASVPEVIPEEILEESYRKAQSNSNKNQLLIIVTICVWIVYGYLTGGMGGAAGSLGGFVGALLITFLVTRAVIKYTGRTRKGALRAFFIGLAIVFGLRIAVYLILDNGHGNIIGSLVAYFVALVIWLRLDYRKVELESH